jgi:hypothetical protein
MRTSRVVAYGVGVFFLTVPGGRSQDLVVTGEQSIGTPGLPTNLTYASVWVQSPGRLRVYGEVTLNVAGDVRIDGEVWALTSAVQTNGTDGTHGARGVDGAPTGQNVGEFGTGGEHGGDWFISGENLSINCANFYLDGVVALTPHLTGGDGGRGGNGGDGGDGASPEPGKNHGGVGGYAAQASSGGRGGLAGVASRLSVRALGGTIDLTTNAVIRLDNLGRGGGGGDGGDGGDGGRGGDGEDVGAVGSARGGEGGGGGLAGVGGTGQSGRSGGTLNLNADHVYLRGLISLAGSPGGPGGRAGRPGLGGDGGNADVDADSSTPGGVGGPAGNAYASYQLGGDGGDGGPGGSGLVSARFDLVDESVKGLAGGPGGDPGDGWDPGVAVGGKGGNPNGQDGEDSAEILPGNPGAQGVLGAFSLVSSIDIGSPNLFHANPHRWLVGASPGFRQYDEDGHKVIELQAGADPFVLGSFVNTAVDGPIGLSLEYRWLTGTGSVDVSLGGVSFLHLDAPGTEQAEYQHAQVTISDPAVLTGFLQHYELRLEGGGSAGIVFRAIRAVEVPQVLSLRLDPSTSGQLLLEWFGIDGTSYQLQSKIPSPDAEWSAFGALHLGAGAGLSATRTATDSEWIRLQITPPGP